MILCYIRVTEWQADRGAYVSSILVIKHSQRSTHIAVVYFCCSLPSTSVHCLSSFVSTCSNKTRSSANDHFASVENDCWPSNFEVSMSEGGVSGRDMAR